MTKRKKRRRRKDKLIESLFELIEFHGSILDEEEEEEKEKKICH